MNGIAEALMPGPCVICGLSNYPLSCGGPTICPSCDCGDFGPTKIARQRAEIERLMTENNQRVSTLLIQIIAMRATIERMDSALKEISEDPGGYPAEDAFDEVREIARRAREPQS